MSLTYSTTLGYLHTRRKSLITAWSSGTGFAGVSGAALYILLSQYCISNVPILVLRRCVCVCVCVCCVACIAAETVEQGETNDLHKKLKLMNK